MKKDGAKCHTFVALLKINQVCISLCTHLAEGAGDVSGGSFMRP